MRAGVLLVLRGFVTWPLGGLGVCGGKWAGETPGGREGMLSRLPSLLHASCPRGRGFAEGKWGFWLTDPNWGGEDVPFLLSH